MLNKLKRIKEMKSTYVLIKINKWNKNITLTRPVKSKPSSLPFPIYKICT